MDMVTSTLTARFVFFRSIIRRSNLAVELIACSALSPYVLRLRHAESFRTARLFWLQSRSLKFIFQMSDNELALETTDEESVTQLQSDNGPANETTYRKAVNQIRNNIRE